MPQRQEMRDVPKRPTAPIVLVCSVAFWAGCATLYSLGVDAEQRLLSAAPLVSMALMVISSIIVVPKKTRGLGLVLIAIFSGCALGSAQANDIRIASQDIDGVRVDRMELEALEDSKSYGFGENVLVRAHAVNGSDRVLSARLEEGWELLAGERIICSGSISRIDYAQNSRAWDNGSYGVVKVKQPQRVVSNGVMEILTSFRRRAIDSIGGDDERSALLQALVCGYRRNISDSQLYEEFQTCGLAHVVAVSGAHLVIVTGLIASVLNRVRATRRVSIAFIIVFMFAYYVVAGMPVSALRAMIMSGLGLVSYFGKRRPSSLNAIGIALFAMIASNPSASVSASLVLSALSTLGIVLFAPLLQSWFSRTPLANIPLVTDALSLTFAASVLSQLYACSLFNQLPLIAPLANVVVSPLFPITCGLGLVFAITGAIFVAIPPLALAAAVPSALLASVVGLLSRIPYSSIPFFIDTPLALALSAALALILWATWPQPSIKTALICGFAAVLCAAIVFFVHDGSDKIVMLDVGQGDAILVESRGSTLLVDTGNQDSKLLGQLASNQVGYIDTVLITHADDDHCGSLDAIRKTVRVDRIILAEDMLSCAAKSASSLVQEARDTAGNVVAVRHGDEFKVGAFTARVIWPIEFTEDGGNADSLCLKLEYDGDDDGTVDFTAFFTGDAEKEQVAQMIKAGAIGDVDILKAGHHGSKNGLTDAVASTLKPEITLISCGRNNRYGHPAPETLDILGRVGSNVFRTDESGQIRCLFTPSSVKVAKANQDAFL